MLYRERLESLRNREGLTQRKAGEMINLDSGTYSHYEKEDLVIPIKHLIVLCDYYNVSLDYIFSFCESRNYNNCFKGFDLKKSGERLRAFRKENRFTQEKLSELLNTTQSVLSDYEKGKRLIPTPFLYTICDNYKMSADYLLGRIDNPKKIN